MIVDSIEAIGLWEQEIGQDLKSRPVWLHPEWSLRNDSEILGLINKKVKENQFPYRAGYQLHKLYGVDEERSTN